MGKYYDDYDETWILDNSSFPDFEFNEFHTRAKKKSVGWDTVRSTSDVRYWEVEVTSASKNVVLGVQFNTRKFYNDYGPTVATPVAANLAPKAGDDDVTWGWHIGSNTVVHKGLSQPLPDTVDTQATKYFLYLEAHKGILFLFKRETSEKGEPLYIYQSLLFTGLNRGSYRAVASLHDAGDEVKMISVNRPQKIQQFIQDWCAQAAGIVSTPSNGNSYSPDITTNHNNKNNRSPIVWELVKYSIPLVLYFAYARFFH